MNISLLFSSFMHEIGKANTEDEVYNALLNYVKSVLSYEKAVVIKNNQVVRYDPEMLEIEKYKDYIEWIGQRLLPSFFPEDNKFIGLIPIVKQGKMLGVILILTQNEPNNEILTLLQTFAFITGVTIENLLLLEKIRNSEKFMFEILNSINEGIFVLDDNGEIEFANDFGKKLLNENPEVRKYLNTILPDEKKLFTKEIGNHYYTIVKSKFNFSNEIKNIITLNNVTHEIELEKIKQLDKMKTEFIANISHELRTPLTAIKAYTETLVNMEVDPESQKDFLKTILEQSERLETLLNDLLDFTMIESGTMELEYDEFDICETLNEAVEKLKLEADKYDVSLNINCKPISIFADKKRIFQVFLNLIDNAIKFSDKEKNKKFVNITIEQKDDELRILVEDNGIGIPEEEKDKIFDKFYKIDRSLTYEVPGTGLGLSIVKEIIKLHGGIINVKSELGKGTTFEILLPIRK